uniref:MARVEL domain-containing protein n=1 Tax=Caenorhabditis tropicalis TaxID=1561998 RepID=A0A1I7TAZ7_9PELO
MSMYGKDKAYIENEQRFRRDRDYLAAPVYNETVYQQAPPLIKKPSEVEVIELEPVECTPHMWGHPMGLLRWFQLLMFFVLQWLVQITCGGDACTMIMNVFGYTAMGQLFVLVIFLGLSMFCAIILLGFVLNAHRWIPSIIIPLEKVYAILGIICMFIAGILGTWMAILANDREVNYQGRGRGHIQGQWIAAAVLEFLMVIVYIFDFILQRRENYPFTGKEYKTGQSLQTGPGSMRSTTTNTKRSMDFIFQESV